MQSLALQIQALAGSANNTEMSDWANEGAKEIINLLPGRLLERCKDFTTLDSSPNSLNDINTRGKILSIIRSDGTINQIASRINSKFNGALTDSTSMHFATVGSPKWTIYGNNLYVYPTPTDAQPAYIEHIQFPSLDVSAVSSISLFPDEAEYLVVLYAACKVLHNKMNEKSDSLPSDLSVPVMAVISTSLPSYTAPTAFVMPVAPAGVDVDFSEVGTIENFVPPVFTVPALSTISAMSLPTVPVAPTLDSSSIDTSSLTNPTFTAPVMDAPDWSDTNNWITTEEDSEMSSARVQEIQGKVSEFTAKMNEAQAQFTKENAILQKDLQVTMQNANTFEQGKLSKYGAELQSYQAQVSTEVQKWTNETFGKVFQEWTQRYQGQLQEYGNDLQRETARVTASVNDYQAKLGKALQAYQAETGFDMSKYQAETQAQSQKYANDLQQNTTTFANELQKYSSEIQKVSTDNQNALAKFGQALADYSAKIQKHSVDYQWLQGQYATLKQDYNQGIQILIGGENPPQQGGS